MIVGNDLKLSEIRQKKAETEDAIERLLATFVNETGVRITKIVTDIPFYFDDQDRLVYGAIKVSIRTKL